MKANVLKASVTIFMLAVLLLGSVPATQASARQADDSAGLLQYTSGGHVLDFTPEIASAFTWDTFLGGTGEDNGYEITRDGSGNFYLVGKSGATWGTPINAFAGGSFDGYVAKLDDSGTLQWHTFLGGTKEDRCTGIALDGSGNIYVTGRSESSWGAPLNPYTGYTDAFVAKLDSSGILQWNTFLGSPANDYGNSIGLDGAGNIYVTGISDAAWGTPLRAYKGGSDSFVAKLDGSGVLQWNTFQGGKGDDLGNGIALDGSGNIYVLGASSVTWGSPRRAFTKGTTDAFVARLKNSGVLQWSTFLGGKGDDDGNGIVLDGSGGIYVTGTSTLGWGTPLNAFAGGNDAYVDKLDSNGALKWHTFLGGTNWDYGYGITLDESGNVYVTGLSGATWGAPLNAFAGGVDAFAAMLNGSGALQWHAFLGGKGNDKGNDLFVDEKGNICVLGVSSTSWGTPLNPYAGGITDAFLALLPPSILFTSVAAYDGWVLESSENSNKGGTVDRISKTLQIGDDAAKRQYKAILSFNTASLPNEAVITSVVLRIKQSGISGKNPFTTLGGLLVDIRNGSFGQIILQTMDFQSLATAKRVGTFGKTPISGWNIARLNTDGIANINKIGTTQFRLYFTKGDNNNLTADLMKFASGNGLPSSRPGLIITYTMP